MRIWCVAFEGACCLYCCVYNDTRSLDGLSCGSGPLAPPFIPLNKVLYTRTMSRLWPGLIQHSYKAVLSIANLVIMSSADDSPVSQCKPVQEPTSHCLNYVAALRRSYKSTGPRIIDFALNRCLQDCLLL